MVIDCPFSSTMKTFAQCLDVGRPHTLLTTNPRRSGQLEYRYDDTGEVITVPNAWYNQSFQTRGVMLRWQADEALRHADHFRANPPFDCSMAVADDLVRRYQARAELFRSEALRMESAGDPLFPVAAGRMTLQLDLPPA